jgi:hypothetical protein
MPNNQKPAAVPSAVNNSAPGRFWSEIIGRPTLETFATAFTTGVLLDASVLPRSIHGASDLRAFFDATRGMYDKIAFSREDNIASRTYLEWEGVFGGRLVAGATILAKDANGLIERVRLYHSPLYLVNEFSVELLRRLAGKMTADVLWRS